MFEITSAASCFPYTLQAKGAIPEVLVDFLREIVEEDHSIWAITLIPARLGGGMVQEIILETTGDITNMRRVYGFEPVEARLEITRSGEGYAFALAAN